LFVTFGEPRALVTKDKGSIPLVGGARARIECGAVLVRAIGGADVSMTLSERMLRNASLSRDMLGQWGSPLVALVACNAQALSMTSERYLRGQE